MIGVFVLELVRMEYRETTYSNPSSTSNFVLIGKLRGSCLVRLAASTWEIPSARVWEMHDKSLKCKFGTCEYQNGGIWRWLQDYRFWESRWHSSIACFQTWQELESHCISREESLNLAMRLFCHPITVKPKFSLDMPTVDFLELILFMPRPSGACRISSPAFKIISSCIKRCFHNLFLKSWSSPSGRASNDTFVSWKSCAKVHSRSSGVPESKSAHNSFK